jgi:hypothetical protein
MTIVVRSDTRSVIAPSGPASTPGVKGDPGSPGEGYANRGLMAARAAPALLDDVHLNENGREGKFVVDAASSWTAAIAADTAQGIFVVSTADGTKVYRRVGFETLNPAWFGAVLDWNETAGTGTNDSAAMLAAIALSKALAGNDRAGFYRHGPNILIPPGKTLYMGNTTLDPTHGFKLLGHGSGRVNAAPASAIKWADGVVGIRPQNVTTSGDTTIDGPHLGAGIFSIIGLKLIGGYAGAEGNWHCIDPKAPFELDDVWIDGWSGEGINGLGNIATNQRNISASSLRNFRISNCRIGFYPRGPDANIINVGFGEIVSNRQAGYVDDSGIGSNNLNSVHFAANGAVLVPNQTSLSGNRYALKWGGNPANSPSGTTADTTDWYYIEAGGATAGIPAWTNVTAFRAGGDVIVPTDTPIVTLVGCYFEEGTFQQFGGNTLTINGALADRYYRGGARIRAGQGRVDILGPCTIEGLLTTHGMTTIIGRSSGAVADNNIYLDNTNLFVNINFRTNGTPNGLLQVGNGSSWFDVPTTHYTVIGGSPVFTTNSTGINMQSGKTVSVNGNKVLDSRATKGAGDLAAVVACLDHHGLWA